MVAMRRRIGDIELRRTFETGLRILIAGVALALVAYGCEQALDGTLSDSFVAQLVLVAVSGAAGLAAYVAVVMALRVPEARQVLALVRRSRPQPD